MSLEGKPIIGICLGMQLLLESSEEFEYTNGLGLIRGHTKPLASFCESNTKMPHTGWNRVFDFNSNDWLTFEKCPQYFVHSFVATEVDKSSILCKCNYEGVDFIAGIQKGNVAGLQFHPERSGTDGLLLLNMIIQKVSEK